MASKAKSKHTGTSRGRSTKSTNRTTTRGNARAKTTKRSAESSPLGKTAAKVLAGAASAVRAFVPQLDATTVATDGATSFLEKQHRAVERSFAAALGTEDARERRSAMNDVIEQLTLHTQLEETIFYPAVQAIDTEKARAMVLEAYEEHHVVKMILKELPKVDPKADNCEAKLTVLKELVQHHVEEEEREMFPLAERKLGPERSRELRDQMAAHTPAD